MFALHTAASDDCDPTDSDEWRFFVVPTPAIAGQRSIGLARLRRLSEESTWNDLPTRVDAASLKAAVMDPTTQPTEPPVSVRQAIEETLVEDADIIEALRDR